MRKDEGPALSVYSRAHVSSMVTVSKFSLVYLPFECLNWAPVVCLWLKFMFMNVIMCESGWSGQSKGTYYAHVTDKFHKVVPGRCVMAVPGCISH